MVFSKLMFIFAKHVRSKNFAVVAENGSVFRQVANENNLIRKWNDFFLAVDCMLRYVDFKGW